MNKYRKPLLIVSILLILGIIFYMRSCQDRTFFPLDDISSAIPYNAAAVIAVDLPQIFKQINYEDLKLEDSFESIAAKAAINNPIFGGILKDPASAGILVDQDAYFVLIRDTTGLDQHMSYLLFGLKDKSKFEKMVVQNKSSQYDITSQKSYKEVMIDQMTLAAWSDQIVIIATTNVFADLSDLIKPIFNTSSKDAVSNNKHFVTAMKRDDSFKYWISLEPFSYDEQLMNSMGLRGISPGIAEGNYVIGGVDFNNGNIEGQAEFELDLDVQIGLNRLFKSKHSSPIYEGYPTENLAFSIFSSLNLPLLYKSAVGSGNTQEQLESYLKQQGLSTQDFFKSLGGDVMINTYHQTDTSSILDLFITFDLTDMNRFERILTWASKNQLLEKKSARHYTFKEKWKEGITSVNIGGERTLSIFYNEEKMIISNNETLAQRLIKNTSKSTGFYSDLINDSQLAGYVNMNWLSSNSTDAIYDNIEFKLNEDGMDFKIKMLDKKSNALRQLLIGN